MHLNIGPGNWGWCRVSLCRYLAQRLTGNKTEEMNFYWSLNRSGFFSSKLSVIDSISQDNNACHIRFFVDRIMHFLYTSEAVNKFVVHMYYRATKFSKKCMHLLPKRMSLNLPSRTDLTSSWLIKKMISADEEYNYNLWCTGKYYFLITCNILVYEKISYCTIIVQ